LLTAGDLLELAGRHNKDNFIYAALPVEIGLAANRVLADILPVDIKLSADNGS